MSGKRTGHLNILINVYFFPKLHYIWWKEILTFKRCFLKNFLFMNRLISLELKNILMHSK